MVDNVESGMKEIGLKTEETTEPPDAENDAESSHQRTSGKKSKAQKRRVSCILMVVWLTILKYYAGEEK
jgi:hypothetical protein